MKIFAILSILTTSFLTYAEQPVYLSKSEMKSALVNCPEEVVDLVLRGEKIDRGEAIHLSQMSVYHFFSTSTDLPKSVAPAVLEIKVQQGQISCSKSRL